ncbi:Peptidase M55 [Candidatus Hydrogenisulfobacillus filiaventi]|uniref:Peptidase M55 n=1 Tax=Candidatus Hydrogenisulfobacillus filiaventi TaxID=2707344 RepID=A0A6F8ZFI9_9FIRM|nr:M55 family metallopeptidase [Bacillota bacterium]CAB1128430.1 Peptidase M55 [Candidatus Hydrogenisulfobacillus filiaventi]
MGIRLWISVDMEGAAGIAGREQLIPGERLYPEGRQRVLADLQVVLDAALADPGVEPPVVVNDAHDGMLNLSWADLPAGVELVAGGTKPGTMTYGVEEADLAFFLGYHAMAGTAGAVMDHTYAGEVFQVRINGREAGETGINALVAGAYGVPVGLVTGDEAVCREARAWLPEAVLVPVKAGVGRRSARLYPRAAVEPALRAGVEAALAAYRAGVLAPLAWDPPLRLEVTWMTTDMADRAQTAPGAVRTGGRSLRYEAASAPELLRALLTWLMLAGGRPLY